MKKLAAILLLVSCFCAAAVDQVEVYLTITNTPTTGSNIVVNGVTRTWTNAHSATTILTNLVSLGVNNSATNLRDNFNLYGLAFPRPIITMADTNKLKMVFAIGYPGVVTVSSGWGVVTNFTNNVTAALTVRVPKSVENASNRVHIGSRLIEYAEESTNYFKPGWTAATYLVGTTNAQVISGVKQIIDAGMLRPLLTNVVWLSGIIGRTTNGYGTNYVLDSPILTNGVNYGQPFRSPGTGSASEQFGTSAQAIGENTLAIGNAAVAELRNDLAIGASASVIGGASVGIGTGAEIAATNAVAIGNSAAVGTAPGGIALGSFVEVGNGHTNSIGIGASTTKTNQIMLGASTHLVTLPGRLESASSTNNFLTGSNRVGGSWSLTRRTESTKPTGHNIITNSASDSIVYLTAPAGTCTNVGFTGGWDQRIIRYIKYNGGYPMGIANNSGLAPAGEGVLTGTAGDITITNSPGWFDLQYDSTLERWILLGYSR